MKALAALGRGALDYDPALGWTDGVQHFNSHTIGQLERRELCLRQGSECRLTPRGREFFGGRAA